MAQWGKWESSQLTVIRKSQTGGAYSHGYFSYFIVFLFVCHIYFIQRNISSGQGKVREFYLFECAITPNSADACVVCILYVFLC